MHTILNKVYLWFAAIVVAADALWIGFGHFSIDARNYGLFFIFIPPLMIGALFYDRVRNEPGISATFAGAAFLTVFSAACCLLSYLLLTVAGPRIDDLLATIDRALGFHWPAVMAFAAHHQTFTAILGLAYVSVIPQTIVLLLILGWRQQIDDSYGFCLAIAIGALITVLSWAMFPSFGAFSVYNLPHDVASRLGLALDGDYGRALTQMLANGPGFMSPRELRGIVGFPSYHTAQALILTWYARKIPFVRWLALALNVTVLVSTPIHGGHHLVDLAGGMIVPVAAIVLADRIVAWAKAKAGAAIAPQTLAPSALTSADLL